MWFCFLSLLEDEEEEGSYDTDEGQDYRVQPPRDMTSSSSVIGPSPSSVVKLEANQKARNKKQRQELYGKTGPLKLIHSQQRCPTYSHLFCVSPPGLLVWSKSVSLIEPHRLPESVWSRRGGQSKEEAPL